MEEGFERADRLLTAMDHSTRANTSSEKLLGCGEVKTIEGGDHLTTLGKPEFAAALADFLRPDNSK
jgi:hypothetical protein